MKSTSLSVAATLVTLASSVAIEKRQSEGFQYVPLDFDNGAAERVTANFTFGTSPNATEVRVVMDTGSPSFWTWQPGAILNYGSPYLATLGPCNISVPTQYDYQNSPTAIVYNRTSSYAYGGNGKILRGSQFANDTITPVGGSGAISNVQFALEDFGLVRLRDDGSCRGIDYDKAIIGLGPLDRSFAGYAPSFRQNLFEAGKIASQTLVMWFNRQADSLGQFQGGALFGAIDTSKFTGPLVRVENVVESDQYGVYVKKPLLTLGGQTFNTSTQTTCLVDSGFTRDEIPVPWEGAEADAFFNATGGQIIRYSGAIAFNGSCDAIPDDLSIGYTFEGVTPGESITIDVPIKNYARGVIPYDEADRGKICPLNMETSTTCYLGASFATKLFLALDDRDNSVAFAKGGVADLGAGLDPDTLRVIGAGQTFDSV
ncbi:hypothetical protein PVAG01_04484 [Phlyctema vagabunda]|uniref:Peptidase A1 domain-containing protein n=1 Tax=Phlyctema vagabunda TaxID=108571 RepID=A0ABR4PPE0_9HELO